MRKLTYLLVLLSAVGIAFLGGCGNVGVDPIMDDTDEDAIYNIILYDYPQTFNIRFMDTPIPDTSQILTGEPYQPLQYWCTATWDSLFIDINDPDTVVEDSSRVLLARKVIVKQFFRGKLEIIALDTTGGEARRVRLSKNYSAVGVKSATFKKYGADHNTRRGWLLSSIGNTIYGNNQGQVRIWPAAHPENIIAVGTREYPLSAFPVFTAGESLVVSVAIPDSNGRVSIRYPSEAGFNWMNLSRTESGNFEGGFRFGEVFAERHILVNIINSRVLQQDTASYYPTGIGVLYNPKN